MTNTTMAVFTNECSCEDYDIETEISTPSNDCHGDCWEWTTEYFAYIVQDILDHSTTFKIKGFPTWYGTTAGIFDAKNAEELLLAITPRNTEWRLQVTGNLYHLTGILSHHDGTGTITVTPIID